MKRTAAIGIRTHSGWAALVAVSCVGGRVELIERRRIEITAARPGAKQPYHFAEHMKLPEAEKFMGLCFAESQRLATEALRSVAEELSTRSYAIGGLALVLAAGRELPSLEKILAAHPLIHTAEGEFYREVIRKAGADLGLKVSGVRERDAGPEVQTAYGEHAQSLCEQVAKLGLTVGPPWTQDQKSATLAALVMLAGDGLRKMA